MTNLRKLARDRDCQVRLPDICNFDSSTTVLAHVRMAGLTGMSMKADDIFGAHCCSSCHDAVDRRSHKDMDRDFLTLCLLEGMVRTQALLVNEGHIKW